MNKKVKIIEQIKQFENKYFNQDQKKIMIDIIENCPEEKAQTYFDLLKMKRRTGFAFDYSPEIATSRIITLKEDINKRLNVGDKITTGENKLLIGDNYNALKSLLITHKNMIDIIYIDPPYNTESAKIDGNQSPKEGKAARFVYKDKFGRGGWLNMMKSRIELAKELLTDEGAIFISIDDSEQAYLKVLMDDIFEEKNFIKNLVWQTNTSIMKQSKDFRKDHEYVLVYSKFFRFNKLENKHLKFSNPDNDSRGPWISTNATSKLDETSHKYFGITCPNGTEIFRKWKFLKEEYENNKIPLYFKGSNVPRMKIFKSNYNLNNKTPSTIINLNFNELPLSSDGMDSFSVAKNQLESLFLKEEKSEIDKMTPKPVKLIKWLIDRVSNKNVIILDFFAGSGTTGQAVMELNKEDNGTRKFILCTNNENNIAEKITYERLYRIIRGFGTKDEKDFSWIKNNIPFSETKLRVINIDDSVKIDLEQKDTEKIIQNCKQGLKLLDGNYNRKNLNLYYDLAALNPLDNEEGDC